MDETQISIGIVLALISPLMSVIGAYIGVRVGQAKHEARLDGHDKDIDDLKDDVRRLEEGYFQRRN